MATPIHTGRNLSRVESLPTTTPSWPSTAVGTVMRGLRVSGGDGDGGELDRAEDGGQLGQGGRYQPVDDPGAASLALQQPGLAQDLEVVGDRRLGQVERRRQVAHARLTAPVAGHHAEQPQPHRVPQRLEHPAQIPRPVLRQRLVGQRGSTAPARQSPRLWFDMHRC